MINVCSFFRGLFIIIICSSSLFFLLGLYIPRFVALCGCHFMYFSVLNIISADRNRNMHIFFRKKFGRLKYIHVKLCNFSCKMSVIFESGQDILCSET